MSTAWSRWLRAELDRREMNVREAAEALGVHQAVVYAWLAGREPDTPDITRAGVLALFDAAHSSQAYAASEPHREGGPMPPSYQKIEGLLRKIYWTTKWKTRESRALLSMIEAMAPVDFEPVAETKSSTSVS